MIKYLLENTPEQLYEEFCIEFSCTRAIPGNLKPQAPTDKI